MENFHISALLVGLAVLAIIILALKILFSTHDYLLRRIEGFSDIQDKILVAITVLALVYIVFDFLKMLYCIGEAILGYS